MRITQHKRTLNDILNYIKVKNQNGMLRESMMTIAHETGYSNATIHRTLKALELDGMIQIIPSKNQRKPHTIVYLGSSPDEVSDLIQQAERAVEKLQAASNEVQDIMARFQETIRFLDDSYQDYIELH